MIKFVCRISCQQTSVCVPLVKCEEPNDPAGFECDFGVGKHDSIFSDYWAIKKLHKELQMLVLCKERYRMPISGS